MADAISPTDRDRFSALMEDRRLDLGITLREVARRAGISYEVLRGIKAGTGGNPRPLSMRGIDKALLWGPGSTERVLYGNGDPAQLPVPAESEGTGT